MRSILLITTGGTIACQNSATALEPTVSGDYLMTYIPQILSICKVTVLPLMNIDSSNMKLADRLEIAAAIHNHYEDYDGFVITHGTDTMAYTVSLLTFVLGKINKPVVFTGAQIPISISGSDGNDNLYHAFLVANSPLAQVCLVFNGKIIHGAHVYKIHSIRRDAFESCNYPYLGQILQNHVVLGKLKTSFAVKSGYSPEVCEDVFLLKLTPGLKSSIIDYISDSDYKGVVIEAYGIGGIPNEHRYLLDKLRKLIVNQHIPVIVVTQCLFDGVNLNVYKIGLDAKNIGLISAGDMTTETAVSKLMWVLGQTTDYHEICRLMQTNICNEMTHI